MTNGTPGDYVDFLPLAERWGVEVFLHIIDYVQNATMIINPQGTIIYINEEYTKILGVSREKALGVNLRRLEPDSVALKVLDDRQPIILQPDYLHSLGIHAIGKSVPLYGRDGTFLGVAAIFNDVTKIIELSNELERARAMNQYLAQQISPPLSHPFEEYICADREMRRILSMAAKAAKTNCTILIQGESGVGKGVLAKAIHRASNRAEQPLISINCAAIPENLLESELFGYEAGAFTGAQKGGKLGKFELADKGTIFLDEIGDMSASAQAKLLRVLQERELERIGGISSIPIDIRVIAATNQSLKDLVQDGKFRQDLYYRLSVIPITIPPLRERRDDILPQARYFLNKMVSPGHEITLSNMAVMTLLKYDWPGNVRELQNVLEYARVICSNNIIEYKYLPDTLRQGNLPGPESPAGPVLDLKSALALLEKDYITEALRLENGNRSRAIQRLGISRKAFYDKLKRYQIEDELL